MLDQKRYSLDEAVQVIYEKTNQRTTPNGLLQKAKNGKIYICFFVSDSNLRFIQLDEPDNKWQHTRCTPLFGEHSLKRVVIPTDKPNQDSHTTYTIDPRKEEVFPLLDDRALLEFANNPDKNTASIMPWKISATDHYGLMQIAIIQQKTVSNSVHDEYTKWRKERHETAIAEGNFKYFETWTSLEIKRSDLCIPAQVLKAYIGRILTEQNKPDRIQEAINEIRERTGRTFTASQLFREAKNKNLFISFSKPTQALQYVQMDLPNHEHKIITCNPLNAELIIPKSGKGLSDIQEVFKSVDEKIYPILEGQSLIDLADLHQKETKVVTSYIPAKDKSGNDLVVSRYYLRGLSGEGNEALIVTEWLKAHNLLAVELTPDELDCYDEKCLNGAWTVYLADGNFIDLDIRDLFIPPFSLEQFIQSLLPSKQPEPNDLEPQQAPEPARLANKPKQNTNSLRLEKLKEWLRKQPANFDPFDHELTKSQVWEKAKIDTPKSESVINRFFANTKHLISFKAGRRSQPSQTCSEKITLDKNSPAIIPLK